MERILLYNTSVHGLCVKSYKELWYKKYINWVKCSKETEFKMKISNNNVTCPLSDIM